MNLSLLAMLDPVRKYSAEIKEATSASVKAVTQPDLFRNSQTASLKPCL
jgi:hypothetical protein